MNNFGPKPAPSALKNLAGNPGKRAINTLEPQPERETPQCPDWMPAIGRYQWDKIVPELDRLGMLTKLDSAILEGFTAQRPTATRPPSCLSWPRAWWTHPKPCVHGCKPTKEPW